MPDLDRDALIEALEQLGSEDDTAALAAARSVAAKIHAADVAWDALLIAVAADDAQQPAPAEEPQPAPAEEPPESAGDTGGGYAAELAIIERLLARSELFEGTREELEAYREDIAEGEFQEGDRRYLLALDQRLSKPQK